MQERYSRNVRLFGAEGQKKICESSVAVFGVGGVGSYAAEALARAGFGKMLFVDGDCVEESNINRQLVADYSTLGRPKAEVIAERALRVNPDCDAQAMHMFFDESTAAQIDFSKFDYVVDAIDSMASKILLIVTAQQAGCKVVSAMGAGNKLDPTRFEVSDIYSTTVCPLARVLRRELKKRGVEKLTVVYSREEPRVKAVPPGSVSFVPSAMGLALASAVVNDLIG